MSKEALLPMLTVAPQDCLSIILIDGKMFLQESGKSGMLLTAFQDGDGIRKGNLGIRDNTGKQEGMGGAAFPASYPAYAQTEAAVSHPDSTQVGTMPNQAGGVPAGTGQLVELESSDYFIIKILRKGVVKFVSNGYHNTDPCGEGRRRFWAGTKLWSVGFLPVSMLQKGMIPQKPLAANNLMENTSNFFVPGVFLF